MSFLLPYFYIIGTIKRYNESELYIILGWNYDD